MKAQLSLLSLFILIFNPLYGQDLELIKEGIVNNYLHYLARGSDEPVLLNKLDLINLDIPPDYKPYIELKRMPDSEQYFISDSIVLYEFSKLGYAYKVEGDSINMLDFSPYIIEKSGFVLRSGVKTHSGIVGVEKATGNVLYFSGPLLLHDIKLLTVDKNFDVENINRYIEIKYFSNSVRNIKVNDIKDGQEYCTSFILNEEESRCLFFEKDNLTGKVLIEERMECRCKN